MVDCDAVFYGRYWDYFIAECGAVFLVDTVL
jgi:hypothetical protein